MDGTTSDDNYEADKKFAKCASSEDTDRSDDGNDWNRLIDDEMQTGNGHAVKLPSLYIPGETGELAGLSAELGSPDTADPNQIAAFGTEKLKQIYAQIEMKKMKYKLIFATAVINVLLIAYASVLFPSFLLYYHTVAFPILYIIRIVVFTRNHWQPFCLDFCYSVNIVILVFIWALPRSEALFAVIFGAACGPVAVALALFRNSLVFHDYDRLTSAYIHVMPIMLTYIIRWSPVEASTLWYIYPNHTFTDIHVYANNSESEIGGFDHGPDIRWLWIVAIPLIWFTLHTTIVTIIEKCCFEDDKYYTMYKCLLKDVSSPVYNIITFCGRTTQGLKAKIFWVLFNSLYGMLSILVARLCYEYNIANTTYVIVLCSITIYNGASFYIDVVSKRGLEVVNS